MVQAFPVFDCSPGSSSAGAMAGLEADAFMTLPASGAVEAAAGASSIIKGFGRRTVRLLESTSSGQASPPSGRAK